MITLFAAPRTRALRVLWLSDELELPVDLQLVEFVPTAQNFFVQATPTGKIPTIVDGDVTICESGAIVQYLLERYGDGRLEPAVGDGRRGEYLQWLHFAESSAFASIGVLVWLTVYRQDAAEHPQLVEDARGRALTTLGFLETRMADDGYLVGEFSAADIMMGFTLIAAQLFGLLEDLPRTAAYLERLQARPALSRALHLLQ